MDSPPRLATQAADTLRKIGSWDDGSAGDKSVAGAFEHNALCAFDSRLKVDARIDPRTMNKPMQDPSRPQLEKTANIGLGLTVN